MLTVAEIIQKAGGVRRIAQESVGTRKPVKKAAIHRWRSTGIDEAHWPLLMRLVPGLTVQQLFDANRAVERERPRRRPTLSAAA